MSESKKQQSGGESFLGSIGSAFKGIDDFGDKFELSIDRESSVYKSYMGAIATILFLAATCVFSWTKYTVLKEKSNVQIMGNTLAQWFTSDFIFS